MSRQTMTLTPALYEYMLDISVRESNVLGHLRKETQRLTQVPQMQIAPEQGQFMAFLVNLMGAKKTLEIGTFTGYSSLVVAAALPADGKVVALDVSEEWTAIAHDFWQQAGVAHKIDLRINPALKSLDELITDGQSGSFDFVFIDADKANYPAYYEKSLQLVRTGGVIALDNVFQNGKVVDASAQGDSVKGIREVNSIIKNDTRVQVSLVPIADGLTLVKKL